MKQNQIHTRYLAIYLMINDATLADSNRRLLVRELIMIAVWGPYFDSVVRDYNP